MTDPLFKFEPDEELPRITDPVDQPIRDDQVTAVREAFTSAGIDNQELRRELVQSCVVRPIASLRELTAAEAHRVLKRIKDNSASKPPAAGASDWDLREEDTWIDKL